MADKSSFIEYVNIKGPKNICSVSSVKKVSRKLNGNRMQYDKHYGNRSCNKYHQKNSTDNAQLLISNLHYGVTDYDIQQIFLEMGPLKKFGVQYNYQGQSLGTAEVIFEHRKDAIKAWQEYNGRTLDGKPLIIQLSTTEDNCACEMFSFKQSRFVNSYASSYDRRLKNKQLNGVPKSYPELYGNKVFGAEVMFSKDDVPVSAVDQCDTGEWHGNDLIVELHSWEQLDVRGGKRVKTKDDGEYINLDSDEEEYNNMETNGAVKLAASNHANVINLDTDSEDDAVGIFC